MLEGEGIATVCLSFVRQISERVRPPRGLLVRARGGFTMGAPGDGVAQRRRLRAALALLESVTDPGAIAQELVPLTN